MVHRWCGGASVVWWCIGGVVAHRWCGGASVVFVVHRWCGGASVVRWCIGGVVVHRWCGGASVVRWCECKCKFEQNIYDCTVLLLVTCCSRNTPLNFNLHTSYMSCSKLMG